jgi:hypothetical protein
LFLHNATQCRCYQALRQDAGRNLIQQRLEQVMVRPVDIVRSTSDLASTLLTFTPPKPLPTTTTLGRKRVVGLSSNCRATSGDL